MTRKTTAPKTAPQPKTAPKRHANKRGGKRKAKAWPRLDASAGEVVFGATYTPDGSDADDT